MLLNLLPDGGKLLEAGKTLADTDIPLIAHFPPSLFDEPLPNRSIIPLSSFKEIMS